MQDGKSIRRDGMNKHIVITAIVVFGLIAGVFKGVSGCNTGEIFPLVSVEESETIVIAGSTSMEKLARILSECFMKEHVGMMVTTEFTGSSAGVEAVLDGRADLGISSRELTKQERDAGAVAFVVAVDGIAVVTDPRNPVKELTMEQLTGIYTGKIRDWSEVGGFTEPIVVVGREAGSGSRSTFENLLMIRDECQYANEMDSEGAVIARTAVTPGAIGYASLEVCNDTVCTIDLDGMEATEETIRKGVYPLRRYFFMVTKGERWEQRALVQEFLTYLRSEEGKKLVQMVGLIVPEE